MKNIRLIVTLCGFFCILFCSCTDISETTKSSSNTEMNYTDSTPEYINNTKIYENDIKIEKVERGSIDTIRDQLEADLRKTYNNVKIENARIGEGNIMPSYDIKIGGNPDFNFNSVVEYLYADKFNISDKSYWNKIYKGDAIDKSYPATLEPTYTEEGIRTPNSYNFDIDKFSPSIDDYTLSSYAYSTGAVWGSETGGGIDNEYYYFEGREILKRYDLKYHKPDANVSYTMVDGNEWNVNEAITFIEDFWNTYLSLSDVVKYTYEVKTLFVVQLDTNKYGYLFEIERKDENGNYFDVDCGYIQDDEAIENGNPFKIDNSQMTWTIEKEVITRYLKDESLYTEKQTDEGNNLLTLGKATDILSKSLAPNIDLKVSSAELNYVIVCKEYPFFQIWKYPWYYESICLTQCDFEIKPYWCFRTDKSTLINYGNCEIYFIDAVTGELSIMV